MKKISNKISLILIGLLIASCSNFSEITVGEINDLKVKGFKDNALVLAINIPVDNPTIYKIRLTEFEAKIYLNNQYLGKADILESLVLPAKTANDYDLVLKIRMANFLGSAFTLMNLKQGQKAKFRMEGTLKARSFVVTKKIEISETREIVI